jgi:hypothetical protein
MDYRVVIEKAREGDRPPVAGARRPASRRFPPTLQFLTDVDPAIQNHMSALAWQGHRKGRTIKEISTAIKGLGRALGYHVAIGVQEVSSDSMPSYPGQRVVTTLIMLDISQVFPGGQSSSGKGRTSAYGRAS